MQFRQDINGLRAYAVLAVMLFHFGVRAVPGGFIGVDVFFVLSGYLMTAIITGGLAEGRFSFTSFYLGRARRIIPALAVLCVTLLAFGWFWLAPADYKLLGKHAAAAMGFVSNFAFRDEEGYFDVPSQTKWLLHTWSLAVEWQFYLVYPLILAALARWISPQRRVLERSLWLLGILSLGGCIWLTRHHPTSAFYLLPTRAWEMLAGGLVYFRRDSIPARYAAWVQALGMGAIFAAALFFTPEMAWPGDAALLPVMGAVLVLLANRPAARWFANPLAEALGRWSYSVYLWHWPLVVALTYFRQKDSAAWAMAGFVLSIALGAISYAWVEQPTRRYFSTRHAWRSGAAALATIAIIVGMGGLIRSLHGIPARVPAEVARIDAEADNHFKGLPPGCGFNRKTQELKPCDMGNPIRWVVWGDSHAGAIVGAVQAALPGGIRYYTHQCAMLFDTELNSKGDGNHCTEYMRKAWAQIQQLPPQAALIVINRYSVNLMGPNEGTTRARGFHYTDMSDEAQRNADPFQLYSQRLVSTLCTLAKSRKVYAVKPIPEIGLDVPKTMAREWMVGNRIPQVTVAEEAYHTRNRIPLQALEQASRQCGITLLDPAPYLCDGTSCYGARNNEPYYFDDDHLSEHGNRLLVPMFQRGIAH